MESEYSSLNSYNAHQDVLEHTYLKLKNNICVLLIKTMNPIETPESLQDPFSLLIT